MSRNVAVVGGNVERLRFAISRIGRKYIVKFSFQVSFEEPLHRSFEKHGRSVEESSKLWAKKEDRTVSLLLDFSFPPLPSEKGKICVVIKMRGTASNGNIAVLGRCKFVQEQVYRVCN